MLVAISIHNNISLSTTSQLWFQILSYGRHSKEAIETMDMPRRCSISFEHYKKDLAPWYDKGENNDFNVEI